MSREGIRLVREAAGAMFGRLLSQVPPPPPAPPLQVACPGVYQLDALAYHADPCPVPSLSAGVAHTLLTQSPLHAKYCHPRLTAQPPEENGEHTLEYQASSAARPSANASTVNPSRVSR